MPIYGAPELNIKYTFIAVAPITAEHPIGSGTVVTYQPGDPFPGEEWGNAAHNLVEVGKAVRLAVNIDQPVLAEKVANEVESTEMTAQEVNASHEEVTSYPVPGKAGWFELSDGTKIRGEEAALEAQSVLDEGDTNE